MTQARRRFSNIQLPRTTVTIRHTSRGLIIVSVSTAVLWYTTPACSRNLRVRSSPAFQLTLFNRKDSKCWPPVSTHASNLLKIFLGARRRSSRNTSIKTYSSEIALQFLQLKGNNLHQARSTFYVIPATSAKFGLRAGNTKFNTQNEERSIGPHTLLCICCIMCYKNGLTLIVKTDKKISIHELG
jgi:hypothetical protein